MEKSMDLANLKRGDKKKARKRVGRGEASGWGKTSGKGHKGQKSRSGASISPGFEGGQMPLQRRLPKKGFNNKFRTEYNVINLKDLAGLDPETEITGELLRQKGLVKRKGPIKLLSMGDISQPYTIKLERVSRAAREKVEAASGKVIELFV
jgi:large subunit ribosomal protein L15